MKVDVIQSDIPIVRQIVDSCYKHEIQHIVISPGSRNAPLAISFSNHPYFKCYSIVDERCAGFFAMGIAQQINTPVALVCTSGSALLNYYPAISEAFYSQIPLMILSADRPVEFIDIGDGQTIRQSNVFANHVVGQVDLVNAVSYNSDLFNNNEIALSELIEKGSLCKLPFHVNTPLYEPLYNTIKVKLEGRFKEVKPVNSTKFTLETKYKNIWQNTDKILVIVGVLPPNSIAFHLLEKLLKNPAVLVMTETTSNLYHPRIVSGIDKLIAAFTKKEQLEFQPQLLLTFGGMVVSKKIKALLRHYQPKHHWHVDLHRAYDTYFCLSYHFEATISQFITELPEPNSKSGYQNNWVSEFNKRRKGHSGYLTRIPYSDLKVFSEIFNRLESNICLHLSNSSTIRYSQLFDISNTLEIYCNRGTSGIDGSTSTAIGAAVLQSKPTFLITGDLSFLYDSNALWNNYIPDNFKIIIVNNNGGGIFRILPGDKSAKYFEEFLETKHKHTAEQLAKMYDFEYLKANESNFIECIEQFVDKSANIILEIFTPSTVNDMILLDYFSEIKQSY